MDPAPNQPPEGGEDRGFFLRIGWRRFPPVALDAIRGRDVKMRLSGKPLRILVPGSRVRMAHGRIVFQNNATKPATPLSP